MDKDKWSHFENFFSNLLYYDMMMMRFVCLCVDPLFLCHLLPTGHAHIGISAGGMAALFIHNTHASPQRMHMHGIVCNIIFDISSYIQSTCSSELCTIVNGIKGIHDTQALIIVLCVRPG